MIEVGRESAHQPGLQQPLGKAATLLCPLRDFADVLMAMLAVQLGATFSSHDFLVERPESV